MGTILFQNFRGELAPEHRRSKENIYASCSINVNHKAGSLKPYPCPEEVCQQPFDPKAIFAHDGCDCVGWENDTMVDQDRRFIYWHDEVEGTRKSPKDCFCDGVQHKIGLPCPLTPPIASTSGSGGGCTFDPRTYYYTYVAKFCDGCESEGPLSPPSSEVACGSSVSLGGFSSPPAGYGITNIRLYRTVAGWKSGDESSSTNTSGAILVAELPLGQGYVDSNPVGDIGFISPITYDMESLPSDGDGIGVTAFSTFVWKGKDLYISVDGMVDVYRDYGHFCFDHDIIAARYWNGSIYVFTERWNYRIDEQAGDGAVLYSNPPYRFETLAPIANKYSISVGHSGVFYAANSGVAVVSGNDMAILPFFTTDQWKSMGLDRVKTHVYQQYLFVYSEGWDYSHLFEIEDNVYGDVEYSNHTRYPYSISAMFTTDEGDLRFASDGVVYKFIEEECYNVVDCDAEPDLCKPCCEMDYRIDLRDVAEIGDLASAYIYINPYYGDVTFQLWRGDCGDELLFEEVLEGCEDHEFKLPGCGPLSKYKTMRIVGCAEVYPTSRLGTNAKLMGRNS